MRGSALKIGKTIMWSSVQSQKQNLSRLWVCALQMVEAVVRALPLREDLDEAGAVYGMLCDLAESLCSSPQLAHLLPALLQVQSSPAPSPGSHSMRPCGRCRWCNMASSCSEIMLEA